MFDIFTGDNAAMMASVVAFVAFFLMGRVVQARQGVALAFGLTPLLVFFTIEALAAVLT